MLEIVFNDSARISLMMAQRYGSGPYQEGQFALLFAPEIDEDGNAIQPTEAELEACRQKLEAERRAKWEASKTLGGNKADIFGFELSLSRGDISEAGIGEKRQQILRDIKAYYREEEKLVNHIIKDMLERLERLCSRIKQGEPVRIWYGDNPDEACGVLWFAHEIYRRELPHDQIYLIKIPEWKEDDWRGTVFSSGVRELSEEQWQTYLHLQKKAPAELIEKWAERWNVLQEEEAPLRAVVNGMVVSVAEDFYDPFILNAITSMKEKFKEFQVFAVLYEMNLGLNDSWISQRIDQFIGDGLIKFVGRDPELPRQRILEKMKA